MFDKPLATGAGIASPVSSMRLIRCSTAIDIEDPVLINFNASCMHGLALAQRAGRLLAKDITSMLRIPVHALAANNDIMIMTNNATVATYLINNCIICTWRPTLSEEEPFIDNNAMLASIDMRKSALVYWKYLPDDKQAFGAYIITIS